jgi:hypothetical protein
MVAGGNWMVNDEEDIYSGVRYMDTIRIGFFLEELSDCHAVHVILEMHSYLEKRRRSFTEQLVQSLV